MAIVGKAEDMFLYYWGLKSSEMDQTEGYPHGLVIKNTSVYSSYEGNGFSQVYEIIWSKLGHL